MLLFMEPLDLIPGLSPKMICVVYQTLRNSLVLSFMQDCNWNRRTGLFSSSLEFLLPGGETCFYVINLSYCHSTFVIFSITRFFWNLSMFLGEFCGRFIRIH